MNTAHRRRWAPTGRLHWLVVSAAAPAPDAVAPDLVHAQQNAVVELVSVPPVADELAARFAAAGHRLYLVGGSVRDALLGRTGGDLDFTTDARPDAVLALLAGWADAVWETGIAFGTVGARRGDATLEITTFRADAYDRVTRNPVVAFGDSIAEDLVRRDFTVNAMAVELTGPSRARSSTRTVGWPRWPPACWTPRPPRRSRSPTIRCGCCGRPGSSPSSG